MLSTYRNPEYTNLYDGLTAIAPDGKTVPALATAWKNVDSKTWEFKLRQGVKFHNGDAFTAEDVKYSLSRVRDPANKSPVVPLLAQIADIDVIDTFTVNVRTTDPTATLPSRLGYSMKIVPARLIREVGNAAFAASPVGTGPYKFVEWVKGSRLVHEANESYWGGAPAIKKVTYLSAPEASTRVAMLLNGEADLIEQVLDADIDRLKADSKVRIIEAPTNQATYISMNSLQPPFNDKRVRQAVNYAVNVDSIVAKVMGGHATRTSISNCHLCVGYDKSLVPYKYDPEKARKLLADAGYGPTKPFPSQVIDVGQGRQPSNIEVSEAVAGYLTAVGISTKVNVMESGAQFSKFTSGKAILIFNANGGVSDSDDILGLNFNSKRRALYWNSPEMDALLDAAVAEFDPQKRERLYSQVSGILLEEAPHLFLFDVVNVYAARADLDWAGPLGDRSMPFGGAKYR